MFVVASRATPKYSLSRQMTVKQHLLLEKAVRISPFPPGFQV